MMEKQNWTSLFQPSPQINNNSCARQDGSHMSLEDVLCSKCRIKILKLLLQFGQLNASEIARNIGISYGATFQHLRLLVSDDILTEKRFGRTRLYRFNEQSPKARAVLNLLQTW
jgi:predicted transcriptional regulator